MKSSLAYTASKRRLLSLPTGAASILLALSLNVASHAAPITWGPATPITPAPVETDVLNTGTVVGAFNLGAAGVPGTTVNGVAFAPFAIAGPGNTTVGNFTLSVSGGPFATSTGFGSVAPPFSLLTAPYQTLLESGAAAFLGDITLTMAGLSVGQAYAFEWWSNDSGPAFPPYLTSATSVNTVVLNDNTSGFVTGGLGQYAIGTFTADNATEVITFSGATPAPVLDAFQLRTVPEPATWAILLSGLIVCLARKRAGTP